MKHQSTFLFCVAASLVFDSFGYSTTIQPRFNNDINYKGHTFRSSLRAFAHSLPKQKIFYQPEYVEPIALPYDEQMQNGVQTRPTTLDDLVVIPSDQKEKNRVSRISKQSLVERLEGQQDQLQILLECYSQDPWLEYSKKVSNRVGALRKTLACCSLQTKNYRLQPTIIPDVLSEYVCKDDLEQFSATPLGHVLHEELLEIAERAVVLPESGNGLLREALHESKKLAIQANVYGYLTKALQLTDFSWAVLDCLCGLAEGVGDGVYNTTHVIAHPIETGYMVAQSVVYVGNALAKLLIEVGYLDALAHIEPTSAYARLYEDAAGVASCLDQMYTTVSSMTKREQVRAVTSCVTEGYLCSKMLSLCNSFLKGAHIKATRFADELSHEQMVCVLATAEGVEVAVGVEANNVLLVAGEGNVAPGKPRAPPTPSSKKVVKGFVAPRFKIVALKELFNGVRYAPEPLGDKLLQFNFEHFLYPDVKRTIQQSGRNTRSVNRFSS